MLQIRLLGQFDIRLDGKRVMIPSRAGQSLFAYLALTAGTAHRREKLAGTFWPETSDENARKNLRQELWRIRKVISAQQPIEVDYLLADEFTLKFNREAEFWLDVAQMERPDRELRSLLANLSLYQGELLPGFYEEWITLERDRIQAIFDTRMEQLLEQLSAAERWTAVQEWGERWLTLNGARETAFRALMLASGARGDMAKVAALYQRCKDELLEDLGIEPSAETRALYDGLLKGAKTPPRAPAQPSGTITFLFTDIEGSTRLLDKMGDQYAVALAEHHEIMRAAIQKWNGREMDTQGDAFFVTFARALDAVQCAAEAQRALATHTWHQGQTLRVRMGLHTGEPLITSTGYVGMDVHRAARIGDAGHGGQILLSQTTRELVIQDLPKGIAIRDLGEQRLKDMKYPAPIYQLVVEGLPANFAPIRTKFTGTEAPTPGEAPFKGLQFFEEGDAALFFGREALTAKLLERIRGLPSPLGGEGGVRETNSGVRSLPSPSSGEGPGVRFLSVIVGASGSGKSSLVRAGLVPALKKGGAFVQGISPSDGEAWQVHTITPTAHPLEALAIELTRASESVTAAATLVDDLTKDPRSLHFFLSRNQLQAASPSYHTLLVIDQFEELFTLCRDEFEREAFIDNLLTALTPTPLPLGEGGVRKTNSGVRGNLTLIITLRADFYAHLAQYPELRDAVAQHQEYIGPMTPEELRRAMEEPARRGHWEFESGLVDLILRDVGDEPGALPLLSHALLETWKRRAGHVLTLKGYADAGGVRGAIAHTAENAYQTLSPKEQTIMRDVLLRLTEFGEGTEDTRRRASFEELMAYTDAPDEVRGVLNRLADARLITLSEDTAEVAHEALIREWPRLREWLAQDREGLLVHRHLTEAAHDWELLERDPDALYRGARLAQAREWASANPARVNIVERAFLAASAGQEEHDAMEREAQRQRELAAAQKLAETERARAEDQAQSANRMRTRNRIITTVGILAILLAMVAGMFGVQSNQNANHAQNNAATAQSAKDNAFIAQATALAASTQAIANADQAAQNAQAAQSSQATAQAASIQAIADFTRSEALRLAAEANSLLLSNGPPELVALLGVRSLNMFYSPSGDAVLSNATLMGSPPRKFTGHTDQVWGVAFSPDGRTLATASDDETARLWDLASGETIHIFSGHTDQVWGVAFSPDGKYVATSSRDRTARLWDLATGQTVQTFVGHTDLIEFGPAFSPDGKYLLTGSNDHAARLWDVATGETIRTFEHSLAVYGVAFSPDGKSIGTASGDGTGRIWDAATGELLHELRGHDGAVNYIRFSPDGSLVATSDDIGMIRLWDTASGQLVRPLEGHKNVVHSLAFSPDGKYLLSGSRDRTARLWDVATGQPIHVFVHPQWADVVAFSPDGKSFATGSSDSIVRLWNLQTTTIGGIQFIGHTGSLNTASFSPDGKYVVTASQDGTARLWEAATGQELLKFVPHNFDNVLSAIFSPDGKHMLTTSWDTTARLWDVVTGEPLLLFAGHTGPVRLAAFSPDGNYLVTTSYDGTARVWDAHTAETIVIYTNQGPGHINRVAFSPDGKTVITSGDDGTNSPVAGNAHIWDPLTGQELMVLPSTDWVTGVAFSPDGKLVVTANGSSGAHLWDVASGTEVGSLIGHQGDVRGVAFSPDGKYVATSGNDGTARLWEVATGEEVRRFSGHTDSVISVVFSPDGKYILTASADGTARLWLVDLQDTIHAVCALLTRDLTAEERVQFGITDEEPTCPTP